MTSSIFPLPFLRCFVSASTLLVGSIAVNAQVLVQKTAEPFETLAWRGADDSSAGGRATLSAQVPTEIAAKSKNSLELEASFAGTGFQFFKAGPVQPLIIPGITKKLSVWTRTDTRHGWVLGFKDGWGRSEANGKKLDWNVTPQTNGTWQKMTFTVPADWVQPITIDGILVHNWEAQNQKASIRLNLDQLEVETDIADVDTETGVLKTWKPAAVVAATPANPTAGQNLPLKAPVTPLLKVSLSGTQEHNVFSGVKPQFSLSAQNWQPAVANGTIQWKLFDPQGQLLKEEKQALAVEDNFTLALLPDATKFGVYRLDSNITWANGKKVDSSQSFAVIPVARPLTEAEKEASPYGLNVHSGGNVMVSTFRKAGITWFRDYGFNYEWMVRAKGADKSYGGWPYYPKIVQKYQDNGGLVLANLATAIRPPASNTDGKAQTGPDLNWVREIAMLQMAFPALRYFELDNEYDLNAANAKAEDAIGWKNYGSYHRKFGDIAQMLGNGQLVAVENGRAGIWPERVRRLVQSGDFASIDVVNSHHYTGTDAPELNVGNHNMGFAGDESVMSFFDQLRAAKQAAISDGKPRQHWLTEFGWDTKAGPVVSHVEQAAYLQRAYMMLQAAGTEKGFWFFDLDAPKANQFFDGCGLFTHDKLPKLSYAAFAGLTQILPKPQYLGTINAGENTWGYLFRNEGKLVASLWTLDGKKGPRVSFEGAQVYDWFANPLPNTVELGIEPVFAVGVAENSRWFQQAAYSLETPHLLSLTAGDSVTAKLQVKNTRTAALRGKVRLQLPAGWTATEAETSFTAAPGQTAIVPLTFRVGTEEQLGEKKVRLSIYEGEAQAAALHTIPLRVQIQRPIVMTVRGLKGEPGEGDVTIRLSNRSAQPLSGKLRFQLPQSWNTATPEIAVETLKPMEVRDVPAKVRWTPTWQQNESAKVEFATTDGRTAEHPLIPGRLTIYTAPNLVMDGDLKDWPVKNRLPDWVLGSTYGKPNAALYLAWSTQGLHVALDVHDSKATVPDPQSFWVGDVLELFVDTRDKKTPRAYETGDHQFWLAPLLQQANKGRVYVGQWKRNDEIAATQYDIAGVPGAAVKRADGYVLECLIPAAQLKGFNPVAGGKIGLNLNLTAKGMTQDREVYWAVPKADAVPQPANWGTVTLGN